ncbi:MAG TPA: hypothetical protein DEQ56_10535 [Bacteroidetes bacterium]|jgi:hypothetical protein|nr:hypothetical protein [Bacteroidota bacterium]
MKYSILLALIILSSSFQTDYSIKIAKLKYDGGGDWYVNRTALPNLANFCNQNLKTSINPQDEIVEAGSSEIFNYPYIYMTGHGNVLFSLKDASNLRKYLMAGGFLHIDDNYGLDKYVRTEMKKVFPELDFVELPFNHPIYNQRYKFPNGLPKIHEHDGKPAQGFGLIYKGRLVCYYDYECDLGNGWEDPGIYNDSEEKRQLALKMGANIIQYVFSN